MPTYRTIKDYTCLIHGLRITVPEGAEVRLGANAGGKQFFYVPAHGFRAATITVPADLVREIVQPKTMDGDAMRAELAALAEDVEKLYRENKDGFSIVLDQRGILQRIIKVLQELA